jgi:hypothetical protein
MEEINAPATTLQASRAIIRRTEGARSGLTCAMACIGYAHRGKIMLAQQSNRSSHNVRQRAA